MGNTNTMTLSAAGETSGVGGYGVNLLYTGGKENRQTEIDFICNPKAGVGQPTFINENPTHHYIFQWETKYACPVKKGLSVGSILLIL